MSASAGLYLFLLGLASGVTLLTITSYRRVSPAWVKRLLIASGIFVISRYVAMALFATAVSPERVWAWRRCWFATSVGLTLPSVFAIDQLIRHPAMTPQKLLRWFAPFLLAYAALILFGKTTPIADRVMGWAPRLTPAWRLFTSAAQSVFMLGFVGMSAMLMRKIPSRPIRTALLGLMLGQLALGLDGLILSLGAWYFRPFLYSEMLTLFALWHAYETSATTQ